VAERLRVVRRALTYPADAESLRLVREAGGLSKLSPEAREKVRMKEVKPGEWCDDLPAESVEGRLLRGDVERVTVDEPAPVDGAAPMGGRRKVAR
jgi:hypothetical protein